MILAVAMIFIASLIAPLPAQGYSVDAPTVLITGSNRGIGLELARQYAAKNWNVIATCRNPDKADALNAIAADYADVTIEKLDVTDHGAIDALSEKYKDTPIDVLINNAGITGGSDTQQFGNLQYDAFFQVMDVNVVGPLKIAEAFIDQVAASDQKKIVSITSSEGSLSTVHGARNYFYRPSKAALNMVMLNLSREISSRDVIIGLINPGPVATDMMKGVNMPLLTPQESVSGLISVIESLTAENSGAFLQYDGKELTW